MEGCPLEWPTDHGRRRFVGLEVPSPSVRGVLLMGGHASCSSPGFMSPAIAKTAKTTTTRTTTRAKPQQTSAKKKTTVVKSTDLVVLDDFLAPDLFARVVRGVRNQPLRLVHHPVWTKTWSFQDGSPLEGPAHFSLRAPWGDEGLDLFREALAREVAEHDDVIGASPADWETFTARTYVYPEGTSLQWHQDVEHEPDISPRLRRTGAYVFYTHERWQTTWGGDLLIAGVDGREVGTFVSPKPNRLVLLRVGIEHMIRRVDKAAGENVRSSIAGFFIRLAEPPRVVRRRSS
jgi:hypothetical protein